MSKQLDFMVIGLPRSGTTWASNWLTNESVACIHDPLYTTHYDDWDAVFTERCASRKVGISCTGIWRWLEFLALHPAKKVLLHRPLDEIKKSMDEIGMSHVDLSNAEDYLHSIDGLHVDHVDLFEPSRAKRIWDYLELGSEFDELRHSLLVDIEMQPKFSGLSVGPDVTRRLIQELSMI